MLNPEDHCAHGLLCFGHHASREQLMNEKRLANIAFMNVDLYLHLPESGWLRFAADVCFCAFLVRGRSERSVCLLHASFGPTCVERRAEQWAEHPLSTCIRGAPAARLVSHLGWRGAQGLFFAHRRFRAPVAKRAAK